MREKKMRAQADRVRGRHLTHATNPFRTPELPRSVERRCMSDGTLQVPRGMGSFELMRTLNRLSVLNAVRRHGTLSRAQLTEKTGLTSGAITYIVEELLRARLLNEVGHGKSSGGRRPVLLTLNPGAVHAIGVNLGVGHMVAVVLDLGARVVHRVVAETPGGAPVPEVVDRMVRLIDRLIAESGLARDSVNGVGVGVPGQHDLDHGIVRFSPNLGWRNVPFREMLAARVPWPVILDNDVRAATLAEKWYGVGRDVDMFACVFVGTGVGAGIVMHGQLLRGPSGTAGELGHTTLVEDGPRCSCGNYGCLEALISRRAVVRRAAADMTNGRPGLIRELSGGDPACVTLEMVIEAAREGDVGATAALRQAGHYLGIALANLVNLFNPRVVAVGGSVARAGELLMGPARTTLKARALAEPRSLVQLVTPSLHDPGAVGAATLVSRQLFFPPLFEGMTGDTVGQEYGLATLRDWVAVTGVVAS